MPIQESENRQSLKFQGEEITFETMLAVIAGLEKKAGQPKVELKVAHQIVNGEFDTNIIGAALNMEPKNVYQRMASFLSRCANYQARAAVAKK